MDIKRAHKIQKDSFKRRWKIRESKAMDYATEDILSNFKRMSKMATLLNLDLSQPSGVALFYALLKIDRLCNLLYRKKTQPKNESLRDTIDDLKNYIDLMEECMYESIKLE